MLWGLFNYVIFSSSSFRLLTSSFRGRFFLDGYALFVGPGVGGEFDGVRLFVDGCELCELLMG